MDESCCVSIPIQIFLLGFHLVLLYFSFVFYNFVVLLATTTAADSTVAALYQQMINDKPASILQQNVLCRSFFGSTK